MDATRTGEYNEEILKLNREDAAHIKAHRANLEHIQERGIENMIQDFAWRQKEWEKQKGCDKCGTTEGTILRVRDRYSLCQVHAKEFLRLLAGHDEEIIDYICGGDD